MLGKVHPHFTNDPDLPVRDFSRGRTLIRIILPVYELYMVSHRTISTTRSISSQLFLTTSIVLPSFPICHKDIISMMSFLPLYVLSYSR